MRVLRIWRRKSHLGGAGLVHILADRHLKERKLHSVVTSNNVASKWRSPFLLWAEIFPSALTPGAVRTGVHVILQP
jgi:hypothetical protein